MSTTHTQHVLTLATQRGLLRASHLQELGIARVVLSRLTASGQLERVGRGVYRLPDAQEQYWVKSCNHTFFEPGA